MKRKRVMLVILLFAALAGIWKGPLSSRLSLTGVSDMVYGGDSLFVLDNDGTNYDFLKLTHEGVVSKRITVPKLSGIWWSAYTHLWAAEDGKLYVYRYNISMEEEREEAAVLWCDFEGGKLRPVWELEGRKAVQCQVIDGCLYYAKPSKEGERTSFIKKYPDGKEEIIYEADFPYSHIVEACYDPEQGIIWSDFNSRFYKNGSEFGEQDGGTGNDKAHICIDGGRIVYTEIKSEGVEAIDFASGNRSRLFSITDVGLPGQELGYKDILPLHYGEQNWCAALDLTGSRRIAAVFDYEGNPQMLLSEAVYSGSEQLKHGFLAFVCVTLSGFLLVSACSFYLKKSGGIISVLAKLLLILVSVILAGEPILAGQMKQIFTQYSMRSGYDLLYALADNRLSRIKPEDLQAVSISDIPRDKMYEKLFGGEDYSILPKRLYTLGNDKGEPVISRTYQWVYVMEGDSLRYVVVDDNYYGARVDYYRDREQMKLMEKAMDMGVVVRTAYNDQEGNWLALYVPILDRGGRSIGVMESGMSLGALLYGSQKQAGQIQFRLLLFFLLLLLILSVILRFSLHPLALLKEAVDKMADGHYSLAVKTHGKDEVADISRAFNRMSQQIGHQVEYIGQCLTGYEKFVPQRVFRILDREDITKLELGDHRELTASVMAADSPDFFLSARSMDGEEIYSKINGMMRVLVPAVAEHGGIVDHMLEAGALAYFPDHPEDALKTAVAICEKLHNQEDDAVHMGIGIARGNIRIGIVGQKERAAVKTMSESVTLAGYLSGLAVKYGAGILITGTAAGEIPDFTKRYHVRPIGYLKLDLSDRAELLYDAYDGDSPEVFRNKKKTDPVFQGGLKAFQCGNYYEARQKFAQVLKMDKSDLAARAYVYRCDTYYQMEDQSQAELFLEHY